MAALDDAQLVPRPSPFIELPTLFAQFASALIGALDDIQLPDVVERMDCEAELGLVVGAETRVEKVVAGFVVANDVSTRDGEPHTGEPVPAFACRSARHGLVELVLVECAVRQRSRMVPVVAQTVQEEDEVAPPHGGGDGSAVLGDGSEHELEEGDVGGFEVAAEVAGLLGACD